MPIIPNGPAPKRKGQSIEQIVDSAGYTSLAKHNPEIIASIASLLLQGQSPQQIGQTVARANKCSRFFAGLVESAASYLQQNPNLMPKVELPKGSE